ncbi:flagellar biosynthesis protein FliO [Paraburkholderia hospita]|jgi:flagellar protein FliO/FliZ|uniref:Flagellar protein n=2 Tax=Paraburkholderia hospita TaxID=169430 RepID=A0ABP2PYD7_9BURK|nr:flagellar biosynthesis protein FliO [Paraburkholderia hospita]
MPLPRRARFMSTVVVVGLALSASACNLAHAADMNAVNNAAKIASSVGAGTAVPSLGVGAVLQTIVGLAVVIGLVFGFAWLARRFGLQPGQRGGIVKTIGGTSLGGKERVAVVEIGDTWLVLGAAPGNVRLLHTMPAGSASGASLPTGTPFSVPGASNPGGPVQLNGTFGQRFRDALKNEAAKRFQRRASGEQ